MRCVLQRVARARVTVDGAEVGAIERGLLLYVGVADGDQDEDARWLADKVAELRIFSDDEGRMNRSVIDTHGAALVVSQFTLLADTKKGRRPSFFDAAPPEVAEPLVEAVASRLREHGIEVASGRFAAHMQVDAVNDGPVTLVLDSAAR